MYTRLLRVLREKNAGTKSITELEDATVIPDKQRLLRVLREHNAGGWHRCPDSSMNMRTADKVSKSKEAIKEKLHSMGLPASIEAFEKTSDEGIPRSKCQRIQYVKATRSSITMTTHVSNENSVVLFILQYLEENENMCDDVEKKLHSIESLLRQDEIKDNVCRGITVKRNGLGHNLPCSIRTF
ncbi:hypothetical protein PsorP6_006500 [Peronosclerospora sorghi]|uniref:Uncharacterized protein n=1 Tax=Peronosclerospora sorghi TaxID=230839 RepID=A0ACC0W708_9STRA|nr:hypothetical protein PsorP6_006500 [Peronosclerospora sorghi]